MDADWYRDVRVRALKNFNGHEVGDLLILAMSQYTANLIVSGYLEVVNDPWPVPPISTRPSSE
jgi:hypothetical protein